MFSGPNHIEVMQNHKYCVGQRVNFVGRAQVNAAYGEYKVMKLLPAESGQFLYRIKSDLEPSERVVGEDQLAVRATEGRLSVR